MPFNSPTFLFLFLPAVIALHAAAPARVRTAFLLAASIFFYAWGEPRFVFAILLSSVIDHCLALLIWKSPTTGQRRWVLALGVLSNVGLLFYFKYYNFFIANLEASFGPIGIPHLDVVLPLGISFIVFEKITYIVDVYRKVSAPARTVQDYLLFVFLFPKLLAGPILKFHEMRDQIENHTLRFSQVEAGAFRFVMGLAKKVLVADSVAEISDAIFAVPAAELGFGYSWLGAIAFAVQIYFDFSAYSDMAIGLALMLGYRLRENFNQPYLAIGFADFWKRWHISLSTWIRDYLYVPLGGNRVSPNRMYINLWICFLASGLWHGASWTYVAWGAYHGLFVSADHAFLKRRFWPRVPVVLGIAATSLLVVVGWVIFRAPTLDYAATYLTKMMALGTATGPAIEIENDSAIALGLGLVLCFIPLPWLERMANRMSARLWPHLAQGALLGLAVWSYGRVFVSTFKPFIYFRF